MNGNSFVDGCIPVCSKTCWTYRHENVPNLYPDAFGCPHVILKSVREDFRSVLRNAVNLPTNTGLDQLTGHRAESPVTNKFVQTMISSLPVPCCNFCIVFVLRSVIQVYLSCRHSISCPDLIQWETITRIKHLRRRLPERCALSFIRSY